MATLPDYNVLDDYWKHELHRALFTDLWITQYDLYRVTDDRPFWRLALSRFWRRLCGRTVGRFQRWLHRDCGDW